jgi:hypothetical protein
VKLGASARRGDQNRQIEVMIFVTLISFRPCSGVIFMQNKQTAHAVCDGTNLALLRSRLVHSIE